MLLAVGIAVSGCQEQKPPSPPVAQAGPSDGGKPAAPPPSEVPASIRELPRRQLEVRQGSPYRKAQARIETLPVRGGGVFFGDAPSAGSTIVVGVGSGQHRGLQEWLLVDANSRKILARFGTLWGGSRSTRLAVVGRELKGGRPALLHLEDGRIIEPKLSVPGGSAIEQVRIVAAENPPVVWVFARAADGKTYHGQWRDTSTEALALTDELPFWAQMVRGTHGLQSWTDQPAAQDCPRVLLRPGQPAECLPLDPDEFFRAGKDLLGGRFWVEQQQRDTVSIRDAASGARSELLAGCSSVRSVAPLAEPPRLLAMCRLEGKLRRFELWSPEARWSWETELPSRDLIFPPGNKPVLALELLGSMESPAAQWLDLEKGVLFSAPPMKPLMPAGANAFTRRILAQPPDRLKELWLLDLDQGIAERIAHDIDCETPLDQSAISEGRAVVSCLAPAGMRNYFSADHRMRHWRWTEVIDFQARTRWRTTAVFECELTETGLVLGTKRGTPAQLAIVATP